MTPIPGLANSGATRFDPFVAGFAADPYSHYAHWRARDPVHWGCAPDGMGEGCWYVFDYANARAALADDRFGLEIGRVVPPEFLPAPDPAHAPLLAMIGRWMIFRDPPDHTRLRRLMAPAFARTSVAALDFEIRSVVRCLTERVDDEAEIDLIADIALPLPVLVIARMLGIGDADYPLLRRCSQTLLGGIDLRRAEDSDAARRDAALAADELSDFLQFQINRAKAIGGAPALAGMIAALGDAIDDAELVANCALLLFAGHETTVNLIGNGLNALLRNSEARPRLAADRALLPLAIEELARFDSPSQMTFRFVMKPIRLGGKDLRPGQPLAVVIGAANRDPAAFTAPDRLDLGRDPNRHLSFGLGRHHCLGAGLARREAIAAFSAMLRRWPDMRLAGSNEDRSPSIGLRGLSRLNVFTGAPRRPPARDGSDADECREPVHT
jgi:pimeloyl-[acyl-carrier protein] synthase